MLRHLRGSMTFFKDNSYNIVKMFLYQFGMTFFGMITSMAAQNNSGLFLTVSIYASVFYLGLLYVMTWELGAKERIRVDAGHATADRLAGLKMSLFAAIPNFIVFLLIAVGFVFGVAVMQAGWAQSMFIVGHAIGIIIQAMYNGIVNALIPAGGNALSSAYLITYAITPLPAIIFSTFGYLMGWNNRRLFGFLQKKKK